MFVMMVPDSAFCGNFKESPYNFRLFDLSSINVTVDGRHISPSPLKFAENSDYLFGYLSLFDHGSYGLFGNKALSITRPDYAKGYGIMQFNFTADAGCSSHTSIKRSGNVRVECNFSKNLPQNIIMIIYAEFNSELRIDYQRRPLLIL